MTGREGDGHGDSIGLDQLVKGGKYGRSLMNAHRTEWEKTKLAGRQRVYVFDWQLGQQYGWVVFSFSVRHVASVGDLQNNGVNGDGGVVC